MFSKPFLDLAQFAHTKTREKFHDSDLIEPNPYFIGFGNPNSDILLIGQEMAIDPIKNPVALEMESYRNPEHWNTIINEKISDINYSFNGKNGFLNPRRPYDVKANGTWQSYETLIEKIKKINFDKNLEFFKHCFITEINTKTSKKQMGIQKCDERESLINNQFFKNFPITILATGSYVKKERIEHLFDVEHSKENSDSQKNKKFEVYYSQNKKRILINTRQLSQFYFNREEKNLYFQKVADKVK